MRLAERLGASTVRLSAPTSSARSSPTPSATTSPRSSSAARRPACSIAGCAALADRSDLRAARRRPVGADRGTRKRQGRVVPAGRPACRHLANWRAASGGGRRRRRRSPCAIGVALEQLTRLPKPLDGLPAGGPAVRHALSEWAGGDRGLGPIVPRLQFLLHRAALHLHYHPTLRVAVTVHLPRRRRCDRLTCRAAQRAGDCHP